MDEKISKKQLKEGFKKQAEQIDDLITAAKSEYNARRYHISIALSTLAIEELTKLRKIRDSDYLKGEMELNEWIELTKGPGVHPKKIKKPIEDRIKYQESKNADHWGLVKDFVDKTMTDAGGEKTLISKISYDSEMAYVVHELKISCMYLDYKEKNWFSAKTVLTSKQLEALAFVNLKQAEFNFNEVQLHNKHRDISVDENSESYKNYVNDPLFKQRVEFQKLAKSNKFSTKGLIGYSALKKFKKDEPKKSK